MTAETIFIGPQAVSRLPPTTTPSWRLTGFF